MKVVDLATYIIDELGDSDSISIPSVSFWLRAGSNLGKLNNAINTSFTLNDSLEVVDGDGIEITDIEGAIYAQMYYVYFYQRQSTSMLGAAQYDSVVEVSSDGGTIRMLNKNELSKTYNQLRKDAKTLLDDMINSYKFHEYKPQQVVGYDLYINSYYYDNNYYSPIAYARNFLLG